MAVTQQLARLTPEQVADCRRSVAVIDDLCSFRLLAAADNLDLNWYGGFLQRVAGVSEIDGGLRDALALSLDGDEGINAAYREVPYSIWEHPVACLSVAQVVDVADRLTELGRAGFPSDGDLETARARRDIGGPWPSEVVRNHLDLLIAFYREASERGLCTAMWWD